MRASCEGNPSKKEAGDELGPGGGDWKQLRGKVREKWGELTDDELDEIAGRRDQLVGKLQERFGYERDQAEREVDEFARAW